MRYKPKFCCNCGEKIERPNPSFADSKMFCDVCKHDFVPTRAMPLILGAIAVIFGLFGIGSIWRGGEKPLNISSKQLTASVSNASKPVNQPPQTNVNSNANAPAQTNISSTNTLPTANLTTKPPMKQSESAPVLPEEAVYFCGAPTKKGTPCSRRVRGGGRCWQHKGQAALLPNEKLLASQ